MALKSAKGVTVRIGTLHCAKCHKLIRKGSKAVAVNQVAIKESKDMAIAVETKPTVKEVGKITGPSFRDPATMTVEELTDPDYAKKQLIKHFGKEGDSIDMIACSKCHHCRGRL